MNWENWLIVKADENWENLMIKNILWTYCFSKRIIKIYYFKKNLQKYLSQLCNYIFNLIQPKSFINVTLQLINFKISN